ncbi:MAG: sulfite reductase [NADPH] flavoprotein alpha-component [Roseibacillus sp.]|nr:sulfite reductase [NADPH] flavoprotein alpha-component [Roseibacillus sp.]|tara:strand:- start:4353 stop:6113 length:1761 start_codon:yes stop_codon:yes gene_type:complete
MFQLPDDAPFDKSQREMLSGFLRDCSVEQRSWLGKLLGAGSKLPQSRATGNLLVLYGTESGNSEELAARSAKLAKGRGFKTTLKNMSESVPEDLSQTENLLVVVSTWGEGDPPESAEEFCGKLMSGEVDLSGIRYSVCALGDTSYEYFCKVGKDVDQQLEKFGAKRVTQRVDCDVDFEEPYEEWIERALEELGGAATNASEAISTAVAAPSLEYGKRNPFPARILDKVLLNAPGSEKEIWHLELSLEGSGLSYEVGDSLGVVPTNADDVVDSLLKAAGLTGDEVVRTRSSGDKVLHQALREDYDITALSRKVASAWQAHCGSKELENLLDKDSRQLFKDWSWGRQIVDLLREFPASKTEAQHLVVILRMLPARLYSISSSPREHNGEVHLTVAAVRYEGYGLARKGVASTCLADLVGEGDTVPVFVTPNKRFRLPENDTLPIIMVGPGTGVAPFRAFVEDRSTREGSGPTWLIFGDQRFTYDFLYQLEWQDHLKSGALTRLDVAFSRDQPEKIYVQDRIREKGKEIWDWLEKGAHFYVCGDASRMAPDVHAALLEVIQSWGDRTPEAAETYLGELKSNGRYQRDVY